MNKIHTIPEHIVARIAAGEVIERPAFAVKELVENAIDAGADIIQVDIEDAGLRKIVVRDNGEGMNQKDIQEAYKPHTTSKLIENTFTGIKTLGFRGEALASIAAVSILTIQSRITNTPGGYFVTTNNGVTIDQGPVGMPPGTSVTLQDLFGSVPARKKFLKSNRTEFARIVETITNYAIAYPDIAFKLSHNKRVVVDLPHATVSERLEKVLGKSITSQLMPLVTEPEYFTLSGFVAHPQLSSRSPTKQFIFVNKRVVSDKLVSTAVKEAYGNLLENTQYPVFLLFLTIPHEAVDVNIHPRKELVSFVNHTYVFDMVKKAITKILTDNNVTFHNLSFSPFSSRRGTTTLHTADLLRQDIEPWSMKDVTQILPSDISQLHNTYLIVQSKQGMLLVDQHGAHERILFEQFKKAFFDTKQKGKTVTLKNPIIIDLPFAETERIMDHIKSFTTMGFHIKHKSENTYEIIKVPDILKDRDIRSLILELIEETHMKETIPDIDHVSNTMLSFLACRSAVMAGEKLTKDEAKRLIEKLEQTPNNATCPHGRPTKIAVSLKDLHRMFKRI